jgi:amino acid adenylation domain-containing protein
MIGRLQQLDFQVNGQQVLEAKNLKELATSLDTNITKKVSDIPPNLIPEGCQKILPDMLPLISLSESEIEQIASKVEGGYANIQDIYPLAPLQEGVLFHHTLGEGDADPYVSPSLIRFANEISYKSFLSALEFIFVRHDVFRTAILWRNHSVPVQVVLREVSVPVEYLTFSPDENIYECMQALYEKDGNKMDVESAPLVKLQVAKVPGTGEHIVFIRHHHLISDHIGTELMYEELSIFMSGSADTLPEPTQYRDFVAQVIHQAKASDAASFFKEYLCDVEESTLPFNLTSVHGDGSQNERLEVMIPTNTSDEIRETCREFKISPATLFHAAWALVISHCTNQDDVIFGTVMSGRLSGDSNMSTLMGLTLNTLPLRVRLSDINSEDLIKRVHASLLELIPYEHVSLAEAQSYSDIRGDIPLFSSIFNFRHTNKVNENGFNKSVDMEVITGLNVDNYHFSVSVDDFLDGFGVEVQVAETIGASRIADYLKTAVDKLLGALNSSSRSHVSSLSVLPEYERRQQLLEWNDTDVRYQKNKSIQELFEEQSKSTPHNIAVIDGSLEFSFIEVEQRAYQLAISLLNAGIQKGDVVGIYASPSIHFCVGLLSVLKLGATFVLLDNQYHLSRLEYMIDNSEVKHLIVTEESVGIINTPNIPQHVIDNISMGTSDLKEVSVKVSPGDAACLFYTSGSTGNPKGAIFSHEGLLNYACAMRNTLEICDKDRFLQMAPIGFDVILEEILPCWVGGGCVVLGGYGNTDINRLNQVLEDNKITCFEISYCHWREWLNWLKSNNKKPYVGLRHVIVGCESIPRYLMCQWEEYNISLVHVYGLTESTITTTLWKSSDGIRDYATMPIGQPIDNTQVYVMNRHMQIVPQGVEGELYIGGLGVTKGYQGNFQMTEERFVKNPFYDKSRASSSERLYKTGDIVRWLKDGNLEYLGRNDHQVKVRGFRIELGEIESALLVQDGIKECLAMSIEVGDGNNHLVAYYSSDSKLDNDFLRNQLNARLPNYMVPSFLVGLDRFPLTINGKVDKKSLPQPDVSQFQGEYVAPTTDFERVLCDVWQDILKVEKVGVIDDFFVLGGHSLLATRLSVTVEERLGVELPLKTIFDKPVLQQQAKVIEKVASDLDYFECPSHMEEMEW